MYIPFNQAVPEGAHTPPVYADEDLANIRALRDAVVSGFMPGWSFAAEAADYPAWMKWRSGVFGLRLSLTYSGGYPNNIVGAMWEWTENSEAAWVSITTGGTPIAITLGPYGRVLTADKDAGAWLLYVFANNFVEYLFWQSDEHAAAVAPGPHGTGSLALQDANAVAITGGQSSGMRLLLAPRITPGAPVGLVAAPWDWAATPTHNNSNAGTAIGAIQNAVAGEMKRVYVIGAGAITIAPPAGGSFTWALGHPVWGGVNGTFVNLVAINANQILATTIPF